MTISLLRDLQTVLESFSVKYSKIDGKIDAIKDKNSKIEQKWTLGGLKINRRYATIDFQPSQSPFLIDFPPVKENSLFRPMLGRVQRTLESELDASTLQDGWQGFRSRFLYGLYKI